MRAVCAVESCSSQVRCSGYCQAHYMRLYRYGNPEGVPQRPTRRDRLVAKFAEVETGCWEWLAYIDPGTGYGRLGSEWAHRVSYEELVGPIPPGFQIDHLCRNRSCVRPTHLEPVPRRINTLRGMSPVAIVIRTNTCQRGHGFTPENTYYRPDGSGWRQCRECIRMRGQRNRARANARRRERRAQRMEAAA